MVGVCGPIVLGSWRAKADLAGVAAFRRACRIAGDAHPHIGILGTAEETAPPPDGLSRQAIADMLRAEAGRLVGVAYLIEGTGFRAAVLRGITIGLTSLSGEGVSQKVLPTTMGAAEWLVGQLVRAGVRDVPPALLVASEMDRLRGTPPERVSFVG